MSRRCEGERKVRPAPAGSESRRGQHVLQERGCGPGYFQTISWGHAVWVTESNPITEALPLEDDSRASAPECLDNVSTDNCFSCLLLPPPPGPSPGLPVSIPRKHLRKLRCYSGGGRKKTPMRQREREADFPVGKANGCFSVSRGREGSRGEAANLGHGDELQGGAEKPAL